MRVPFRIVPVLVALGVLSLSGCFRSKPISAPPVPPPPEPPPAFTLQLERAPVHVEQGGKTTVRVIALRGGYQGRIGVELRDLPPGITAGEAVIAEGDRTADLTLTARDDAVCGDFRSVRAVATALGGDDRHVTDLSFGVQVTEPTLFDLKVEPATVGLLPGGRTQIKIVADRRRYDGPIAVELRNLPARISAGKAQIGAGETVVVVEVEAEKDAVPGAPVKVQAVGTATAGRGRQAAPTFSLQVRQPFELNPGTRDIGLEQGERVKFVVTTVRHSYPGAIKLEVLDLPAGVRATVEGVAPGGQAGEIILEADADAPVRAHVALTVRGTPTDPGIPSASVPIRLSVRALVLFQLSVEPRTLTLTQGGSGKVRVTAARKRYDGPITVELLTLPAGVVAPKTVITQGQSAVEIELTAEAGAPASFRQDVSVLGTALAARSQQATSPPFAVRVQPRMPPFDLKVEPAVVRLPQSGTARLRVVATRRQYQGPIDVVLRNLPARVSASRALIGQGQNSVEIDLQADPDAPVGDKRDVLAVGGVEQEVLSPAFTVRVEARTVAAAPYELRVEPVPVRLVRGEKSQLRITAVRRGYDGPISLEVRNLPARVTAASETIARGKNSIDIEVKAPAGIPLTNRTDVFVRGTGKGIPGVDSPNFALSIVDAAFELRVETSVLKLKKGDKAKVRVSAIRQGYQGPITVELRRLPPHVHASRETIARGQNAVEIDVTVDAKADPVERNNVQAFGTSTIGPSVQAISQDFTIVVHVVPVKQAIEVRVEPRQVKLAQGGKVRVRVEVTRKGYEGPIAVELRDLPAGVTATKTVIPAGRDQGEIELTAGPKAPLRKDDARAFAAAMAAPGVQDTSPPFTLFVQKK